MKPPFSYYGGKQNKAAEIVNLFQPHSIYAEPFAGSAAVMFKKGLPLQKSLADYREVLNDHNHLIVNFFEVLQSDDLNPLLCKKLNFTLYSTSELSRARKIVKNGTEDKIILAWAFFVSIQMTFAHDLSSSGWRFAKESQNPACTFRHAIDRLHEYLDRMKYVTIEETDAIDFILRWDSPNTLFYVDPPYINCDQGHYSGYSEEDFKQLVKALSECQGSVVLSCYANDFTPDWPSHSFDALAGRSPKSNKDRKRKELVFVKLSVNGYQPVQKTLFDALVI